MYTNFVYVITVDTSKMSRNSCVVHYQNIFIKNNNKLIEVTNERYEKLINAKKARLTLGGCHLHPDQCDIIPDVFVPGLNYHPECYKHFIRAVSELKKVGDTLPSPGPSTARTDYSEHRPRRSSELDPAGRFPLYCMICRKMVQRDEKDGREFPTKLTLESTEETLRMAVALRHDKELGDAIRGVNLREKDFRKHKICYKNYTSVVSNEAKKTSTSPSHPTDD